MARRKGKVYVAFVDDLKAFNTVDRHSLWLCLSRKGLSRKRLNILKSVYKNVLCCVRSGHDYTEFFESPSAVKQGCLLSPKMFCLSTKWLMKAGGRASLLSNLIEDTFSLLFADAVALVSHTQVWLQKQLNVLARASTKIGLKVNLDKTKVMVFRKGEHLAAHEKWFINGQRLEVVNSYVCLGYR